MGYDVYKNDVIDSGTFTDLAGNTMTRPGAGERRLGTDLFTGAELADEGEVLSVTLVCDVCGIPADSKAHLTKVKGMHKCKECLDG